jgi:hypothetical protein
MELPIDKKPPTMAELKAKNLKWKTKYYNMTLADDLNRFMKDMEDFVNNPYRLSINEFKYETYTDGSPYIVTRFKEDTSIDIVKQNKFSIFVKLFTTVEFEDLDAIINSYDQTTLYLLGEKRLSMKGGDFFILLIWATVNKPTKSTEGLNELRKWLSTGK